MWNLPGAKISAKNWESVVTRVSAILNIKYLWD